MSGIDRGLHIVADLYTVIVIGHQPGIRVGSGKLVLVGLLQLLLIALVFGFSLFELGDSFFDFLSIGFSVLCFSLISLIQFSQVTGNLFIEVVDMTGQLLLGIVITLAVRSAELGTINGDEFLTEELPVATQAGKIPEDFYQSLFVILAEIGNGLKIRAELSYEPHELHITFGLKL